MDLVVVLSIAACAPQAMAPAAPPDLVASPPKATPVLRVAPAPQPVIEPVVEPPAPPPRLQPVPEKAVPKPKCNPMSRAGCRWEKEVDERDRVRVRVGRE